MADLEKMVDQKVHALHKRLRAEEEDFQVRPAALVLTVTPAIEMYSRSAHISPAIKVLSAPRAGCRGRSLPAAPSVVLMHV